jgi:hypothetical protein
MGVAGNYARIKNSVSGFWTSPAALRKMEPIPYGCIARFVATVVLSSASYMKMQILSQTLEAESEYIGVLCSVLTCPEVKKRVTALIGDQAVIVLNHFYKVSILLFQFSCRNHAHIARCSTQATAALKHILTLWASHFISFENLFGV